MGETKEKLTARERLEYLFDPGSFVEIGAEVRHRCFDFGMENKRPPGDGVITGYGTVNGRTVFAFAQDFSVMGGSLGEMHAKKIQRILDLAGENKKPLVGMNDSGGARIQEGVDSLGGYGEIFFRNVKWSGIIPQISIIFGPCAGGAVYSPALTDFVGMVAKQSYMFLTGPKVVKTVLFEEVDNETLGGAMVHSTKSGVAHFYYKSDIEAIEMTKKLLSYLPDSYKDKPPKVKSEDPPEREIPELDTIVPKDPKGIFDTKKVILSVFDKDSFFEVHSRYARNLIVGFARLNGETVGILANQSMYLAGALDTEASKKGARFVRFCNAFNIPIITFVDVPGFMPGTQQEHSGIITNGAKLMYAYCEAVVPRITVIMKKAYGGAYLVMSSKHIGSDIVLAWPSAEIAVMGAEGAVEILYKKQLESVENPEEFLKAKIEEYNRVFMSPQRAAERGFVDAIINPRDTRKELIRHLTHLLSKDVERLPRRNGNIPL